MEDRMNRMAVLLETRANPVHPAILSHSVSLEARLPASSAAEVSGHWSLGCRFPISHLRDPISETRHFPNGCFDSDGPAVK